MSTDKIPEPAPRKMTTNIFVEQTHQIVTVPNDSISISLKQFDHSKILNDKLANDLVSLCEFDTDQKWKRIYCGSINGFRACDFFSKCNNAYKTLIIIESTNGSIFGGYAYEKWSSGYVYDERAFLFSLINPSNTPKKIMCDEPYKALYVNHSTNEKRGPTFGQTGNYGFDLCIKTLSNEAERSYSNLGLTYGKGQFNHNSQTFLTGSYQFKTKEIEVFSFEDKY
jgi:hypothetical protein